MKTTIKPKLTVFDKIAASSRAQYLLEELAIEIGRKTRMERECHTKPTIVELVLELIKRFGEEKPPGWNFQVRRLTTVLESFKDPFKQNCSTGNEHTGRTNRPVSLQKTPTPNLNESSMP